MATDREYQDKIDTIKASMDVAFKVTEQQEPDTHVDILETPEQIAIDSALPQSEPEPQPMATAPRSKNKRNLASKNARLEQDRVRAEKLAEHYYNQSLVLEQELVKKDKIIALHYNDNLETKLEYLKNAYEVAASEGDYKTQAEAQALISEFHAKKEVSRQEHHRPYDYKVPPPALDDTPAVNPAYVDWIYENPWADRDNPEFNQELAEEVDSAMGMLNKHLTVTGRTELIGSREYFAEINRYLEDRYNPPNSPPPPPITRAVPKQAVNPVNYRNSSSRIDSRPGNPRITISPEEKEIALRISYRDHVSDSEKIKRYAQNKLKMMQTT